MTTVQNLGSQLLGLIEAGRIEYRVHGTVTLQGAFGLTLPYFRSGQIDPLAGGLSLIAAAAGPASSSCGPISPPSAVRRPGFRLAARPEQSPAKPKPTPAPV